MQLARLPRCDKALQVALVQVSIVQQEEADDCRALPQEHFRQTWRHLQAAKCTAASQSTSRLPSCSAAASTREVLLLQSRADI